MKKNSRRAFTLVEIMVASTVLLMVVGAALSVFVSINRSMYGLSDAVELNSRTRLTQERVLFDVRALTKITTAEAQAFTGEFVEYGTGKAGTISYSFENDQLVRRVTLTGEATKTTVVMSGLRTSAAGAESASRFLYRNRCGGEDSVASSAGEVRAIQIEFVPLPSTRQAKGLVTGQNTAFCSALVQLRNISG